MISDEGLRSAEDLRRRIERMQGVRQKLQSDRNANERRLQEVTACLERAPRVLQLLEQLSDQLFGQLISALEQNLTIALQEVLEQPIEFKVAHDIKRGSVNLTFHVQRGAEREDILRGQGGSVANILTVGLRFFALATLDEQQHRRFLVLDEQDCWLRPDLVPRLVKIVHDAGKALGFQVLMISHHDLGAFEPYADRIYRFTPTPDGVRAERWRPRAAHDDD